MFYPLFNLGGAPFWRQDTKTPRPEAGKPFIMRLYFVVMV
jgi:hypothetical protein